MKNASSPSRNTTSRHSITGNEKTSQITGILEAETDNSTKCGIDALLKYFLSLSLDSQSQESVDLDIIQKEIEDLQFHRYYDVWKPGESDAAPPMDTGTAPTTQNTENDPGTGDAESHQNNNSAECATEEERTLVQRRDSILDGLFKRTLEAVLLVANNPTMKARRSNFANEFARVETSLYSPFVLMCNDALDILGDLESTAQLPFRKKDALNIHFYRNDPKIIESKFQYPKGSTIGGKPDIGVTSFEAVKRHYGPSDEKDRPFRNRLAETPKTALGWSALLLTTEFRRTKSKSIPEPAKEFNRLPFSDPSEVQDHNALEALDIPYPVNEPDAKRCLEDKEYPEDGPPTKKMRHLNSNAQDSTTTPNRTIPTNSDKLNVSSENNKPPSETTTEIDGRVQCASYALKMLSYSAGVHHVINLLFVDNYLWILYYDRQGILQSDGMCIFENFPRFLVLLFALQRFDLADWGIISSLNPKAMASLYPQGDSHHHDGEFNLDMDSNSSLLNCYTSDTNIKTIKVEMGKPISVRPYCLAGRATSVVSAVDITEPALASPLEMVCKISHPEVQRGHEGHVIQVVRQIAKNENPDMLKHVPNLIFYGDVRGCNTRRIRSMVGRAWKGDRTLRIIVMQKLKKITEIQGAEFIRAWLDTVICHAFLWKNFVEHGDPSLNNIMYDPVAKCGVLCDYDLSILQWEPRIIGTERTGTVPFMAIDLLHTNYWERKIQRHYHHELESFIWILLYVSLLYEDGKRHPNRLVDPWRTSEVEECCRQKIWFYQQDQLEDAAGLVRRPYKDFWALVESLCVMLRGCHVQRFPATPAKIVRFKAIRELENTFAMREDSDTPHPTHPPPSPPPPPQEEYFPLPIFNTEPLWRSTLLWVEFKDALCEFYESGSMVENEADVFKSQIRRFISMKPSFQPPDLDVVKRLQKAYRGILDSVHLSLETE